MRKLAAEQLEKRELLAGDTLGHGVGDIEVQAIVQVTTGFEFLNGPGDKTDLVDFRIGTSDVFVDITGRAGTRGVPPAYNNGAFALGIGEPVTLDFSVPVDVEFALREITEITPDVVGGVVLVDSDGDVELIEADDDGADPPQSDDWEVIEAKDIVLVQLFTSGGITNIDDLKFTGIGRCPGTDSGKVEVKAIEKPEGEYFLPINHIAAMDDDDDDERLREAGTLV